MRLFELLGFDNKAKKTLLLSFALIKHENSHTFDKIIEYFKYVFNWQPSLITMDLSRSSIKSFKKNFQNINIFLCY